MLVGSRDCTVTKMYFIVKLYVDKLYTFVNVMN